MIWLIACVLLYDAAVHHRVASCFNVVHVAPCWTNTSTDTVDKITLTFISFLFTLIIISSSYVIYELTI